MEVTIRKPTIDDFENVCFLFKSLDEYHLELDSTNFQTYGEVARPIEFFKSYLEDHEKAFFVAELEGELIGFANCHLTTSPPFPMFKPRQFVEISNIYVRQHHQNSGIGGLLMECSKNWARSLGVETITVTVFGSNGSALEFYKALGFTTQKLSLELQL